MNEEWIRLRGSYLGHCIQKGDVFSVPLGMEGDREKYGIFAIRNKRVYLLITFKGKSNEESVNNVKTNIQTATGSFDEE